MFSRRQFINKALKVAPDYFHIHPRCTARNWVREFSKYDAGWLHCFNSNNQGTLRKMSWDDLNMPARMNTLAAAGLPMIQKDNTGNIVSMQSHVKKRNIGVFFQDYEDLAAQLYDTTQMEKLQNNTMACRKDFTFDSYVDSLIDFFRKIIHTKKYK